MNADILGYIAGSLTTICFIPQAVKIVMHKTAEGVSLLMYIVFSIGVGIWELYGLALNNTPIIIFNVITLVLCLLIIFNLIKYQKKDE